MSVINIVLGSLLIIFSLVVIIIVLLQEGNQKNSSAITGGAGSSDTFLSKNKSRSANAFLSRWTKVFAVGFVMLVIALNAVSFFVK